MFDLYSIILIGGFAAALLLGFLLGFGKTLKFLTSGIIGIIISIVVCVMFGGIIARIPFISDLIAKGNEYFGGYASILAKINVATILFYIVLFLVVTLVRILIVRLVKRIFEPKDKKTAVGHARSVVNRVLGLLLFGAFYVLFAYLVMAVIAQLEDVEKIATWLTDMRDGGSFFYKMYTHNPIDFSVLFAKAKEVGEKAQDVAEEASNLVSAIVR